jgi:hypothetical protein
VESKKERIRRQMRVAAVITGILALEASFGGTNYLRSSAGVPTGNSPGASLLTLVLAGAFALLGIWCLWQMEQAYKKVH